MSIEQDDLDNLKYQRWLADSLVKSLGYDQALSACQELRWSGTLNFLINERVTYVPEPEPMASRAA